MKIINADELIAEVEELEENEKISEEVAELIIYLVENTPEWTASRENAYWGVYG